MFCHWNEIDTWVSMCLKKKIPALVFSAAMNIKGSIFSLLQIYCEIPYSIGNIGANTNQDLLWETLLRWQREMKQYSLDDVKQSPH